MPRGQLTLRVLEIMSPKGPNLVLATHIPHREADILVLHGFHIESWKDEHSSVTGCLHYKMHLSLCHALGLLCLIHLKYAILKQVKYMAQVKINCIVMLVFFFLIIFVFCMRKTLLKTHKI